MTLRSLECDVQAIALKVRSEGKEYKQQPLKAARGNVAAAKAPAVASKYSSDADPGARPGQPVQVRTHTRVMHLLVSGILWLLRASMLVGLDPWRR